MSTNVPFNSSKYLFNLMPSENIFSVISSLSGGGSYEKLAVNELTKKIKSYGSLITPSCTSALELSAILINLEPGDEVIMPSFTFSSTANAVVLRGATPVFVDCDPYTLNIDPVSVENAISNKTKCILAVHYGGGCCDMDNISSMSKDAGCFVVEDAAQAIGSKFNQKYLGTIGHLGTFSFHETKNVVCGEGGALLINDQSFFERAEIIREKGTNRSSFIRGEVDKYTWQEMGSSYLLGELPCYFLFHQLQKLEEINNWRTSAWNHYFAATEHLEKLGYLTRQRISAFCTPNGHLFYIVLDGSLDRELVLSKMKQKNIHCASHYVPLHSAPAGKKYGKFSGQMKITDSLPSKLIRLPLYYGISTLEQNFVIEQLEIVLKKVV